MIGSKKIACVIPARLKSSRFPRKMLGTLKGVPILQWIWDKAVKCPEFDEVVIAVDADEIAELVHRFGGRVLRTSEHCASGTDRVIEVMRNHQVTADIWVNWQGDEPMIQHQMIRDLLQTCATDGCDVWTLQKKMRREDVMNPHLAKVVCCNKGEALYFSRSPIPFYREHAPLEQQVYFKHIGLYAYTKEALDKIAQMPLSDLECAEQLEQLRFLQNRLRIKVHETIHEVQGIDLPEHLAMLESIL